MLPPMLGKIFTSTTILSSAVQLQILIILTRNYDERLQFFRFWDTNAHIFPMLESISNDQEPAVRQHLMEQLALLAKVVK